MPSLVKRDEARLKRGTAYALGKIRAPAPRNISNNDTSAFTRATGDVNRNASAPVSEHSALYDYDVCGTKVQVT